MTLWGRQVDRGHINPVVGGPAATAGLQDGDKILAIDGTMVADFKQLVDVVAGKQVGEDVQIRFERDGSKSSAVLTLGERPDEGEGTTDATPSAYMGVVLHPVYERMPLGKALGQSFNFIGMTARGIARLFTPSTFRSTIDQSSSVIGISVVAAQAAQSSIVDYATIIAAISLSLGLMNLLPIPPLDGGKIVLEIIQKVTGRPINQKLLVGASMLGFALMVFLMIFVTFNDVLRLIR
jgi:regulator of sigma E protease